MAQPEKRENSVLFSLRELKQIEEKRVAEEEQAAREQEMARIRAKEDDERRRRDADEAKVRAAQDEERRIREAAEQRAREDAMRLQEAEVRARQDAQAALEAQRLQQELEIRRTEANKKRPIKLIALFATILVAGAGYFAYTQIKKADDAKAIADQAQRDMLAAQQKSEELLAEVNSMQIAVAEGQRQLDDAQKQVDNAKDADARAAAEVKLKALREQQAARAERLAQIKAAQEKEARKVKIKKDCVDNPLGC
jgi:colicin import membrane protein